VTGLLEALAAFRDDTYTVLAQAPLSDVLEATKMPTTTVAT
jgi:hypothetical protein